MRFFRNLTLDQLLEKWREVDLLATIDKARVSFHDDPTMEQTLFRWRDDDGTDETDATWLQAVNVDHTHAIGSTDLIIRLRLLVKETAGNASDNFTPNLQLSINGGSFSNLGANSDFVEATDSTKLTDGNDTTQQLGGGTYVSPNAGQDDVNCIAGGSACDYVGSDEAEFEFCLRVKAAEITDDMTFDIRISDSDIDTYATGNEFARLTVTCGELDQNAFRFRNDDGTEATATWKAAKDTNITEDAATTDKDVRLRWLLKETAGTARKLIYTEAITRLNSGSWVLLSSAAWVQLKTTSQLVDQGDTTQQVGSGTFVSTNAGQEETSNRAFDNVAWSGSDETECEFAMTLLAAGLADADVVDFKLRHGIEQGDFEATTQAFARVTIGTGGAHTGTGTMTLPAATQAATGAMLPSGTVAQITPATIQVGVGLMAPSGTGAQIILGAVQSAGGDVRMEGAGVQILPATKQAAVGLLVPSGSAAQTLPASTQAANGVETFTATSVMTLPATVQSAVGLLVPSATSAQIVPSVLQAALGVEAFTATAAQVLPATIQSAVGLMVPSGAAAQTLPSTTQVAVGAQVFSATAASALPATTQAAVGLLVPSGTAAQVLPSTIQSASATSKLEGAGSQSLPATVQAGVGNQATGDHTGSAIQTLPSTAQSGAATSKLEGLAAQLLPSLTISASSIQAFKATGVQTLPSVIQTAAGLHVILVTRRIRVASTAVVDLTHDTKQPLAAHATTLPDVTHPTSRPDLTRDTVLPDVEHPTRLPSKE